MAETAATIANSQRVRGLLRDFRAAAHRKVLEWADAESARIGLWIPVAFGAGAALYFLLRDEPSPYAAPFLLIVAAAIWRRLPLMRTPAMLACLACAGFFAADFRTAIVAAPAIDREISFKEVEGRLLTIDEGPKMRRLVIGVSRIDGVPSEKTPIKVRVSWRGKEFAARPGDRIRLRASLSPPPRPAAPGGFDFARQLYFQRIGAVGFAVSAPTVVADARRPLIDQARAAIETARVTLSRRITDAAEGDSGAIVAAVVTGKRGAISDEAEAAFRDAGLAHLLAISGLHMGLATGLIFFPRSRGPRFD